jgi:hypothetical protein
MEKPQQPFADEALEQSLVLGAYASPIGGVHASANLAFQLASKSPTLLLIQNSMAWTRSELRREIHAALVVLEAWARAEDIGYGKSTSRA